MYGESRKSRVGLTSLCAFSVDLGLEMRLLSGRDLIDASWLGERSGRLFLWATRRRGTAAWDRSQPTAIHSFFVHASYTLIDGWLLQSTIALMLLGTTFSEAGSSLAAREKGVYERKATGRGTLERPTRIRRSGVHIYVSMSFVRLHHSFGTRMRASARMLSQPRIVRDPFLK